MSDRDRRLPAGGGRPIRRLPEHVANQIAAGEVIERPASVVKELVENALDAGARRIEVEVRSGGRDFIRVSDDGVGIPRDQVLEAFERHATSKIEGAADLFAVTSLGFRGEALPSIASVSEVEIRTRPRGEEAGTLVRLEAGRVQDEGPEGCPPGTTIIVRRLFFNTPARYKFLRSPAAEGRRVLDAVSRLALAHPECRFTLIMDGRRALQTAGDGDLRAAIAAVFGNAVASAVVPVRASWAGGRVEGWVGRPDTHRGNRDFQVLALNGRPIHAPALLRAIEKAYETLLPSRRFPVAVLHLVLDPGAVDVNVHPTKREVRFADEGELFRRMLGAVREALLSANLFRSLEPTPAAGPLGPLAPSLPPAAAQEGFAPRRRDPAFPSWSGGSTLFPTRESAPEPGSAAAGAVHPSPSPSPWPVDGVAERTPGPGSFISESVPSRPGRCAGQRRAGVPGQVPLIGAEGGAAEARRRLQTLRLIGVLDRVFLLGLSEGELWVIDQHVAHERVLYERLLRDGPNRGRETGQQRLLHPLVLELGAREAAALDEGLADLEAAGFAVEPFGPQVVRVTGVPAYVSHMSTAAMEASLREWLAARDGEGGSEDRGLRELAASLACRMAVKAGEAVPLEAGQRLLADLARTENPFTCPHGRPVVVTITRRELERRFDRS